MNLSSINMKGSVSRLSTYSWGRAGKSPETFISSQTQRYAIQLICFAIAFPLVKEILVNIIKAVIQAPFFFNLDVLYYPLLALVYLPLVVVLLRFVMSVIFEFPWQEIVPFVFLLALIAISALINSTDQVIQDYYWDLLQGVALSALPFYILFRACKPTKELLDAMGIAALVALAAGFVVVTQLMTLDTKSYSQWLSYLLLPSAIILQYHCFHSTNRIRFLVYIIAAIVSFGLLLSTGARGPLAIAVVYFIGSCILPKRFSPELRFALFLLIVFVAVFVLVNLESVMSLLMTVMGENGLSVRLARLYELNVLFVDDGRSSFADMTLGAILNAPLGVGVGQDCVILASAQGAEAIAGNYPHNIFLEILLQFGIVVGTVILVGLACLIWKSFSKGTELERSYLCIMLMLGVMPLLVSGTYLEWDYFWATLGVCIAIIRPMGSEKRKGNAQAYSEDTCK